MEQTPPERYELKNAMEEIVELEVRSAMKEIEMCCCEKCFKDVCALVLNQIPPKYVTTARGELLGQLGNVRRPQDIDMALKVAMACRMVKEKPMHDE